MELELRGKSVLITSASKGIGLACAHGFAAEGARAYRIAQHRRRHRGVCACKNRAPDCARLRNSAFLTQTILIHNRTQRGKLLCEK
jgi:NAD(P)-dependent dehydrogenase (short-subunit alcohol dehydrogenase family)